jgi:hypothetical protein
MSLTRFTVRQIEAFVAVAEARGISVAASMGLVMRRVCEPETIRKVCLYRRANRPLSPAAEGVAEHLAAWLPAWADGLPCPPAAGS